MSLIENAAGVFVAVARDVSTFEQIVVCKCLGPNEVNTIITHSAEEAKLKSNSVRSVRLPYFLLHHEKWSYNYFNYAYVVIDEYAVKTNPLQHQGCLLMTMPWLPCTWYQVRSDHAQYTQIPVTIFLRMHLRERYCTVSDDGGRLEKFCDETFDRL